MANDPKVTKKLQGEEIELVKETLYTGRNTGVEVQLLGASDYLSRNIK